MFDFVHRLLEFIKFNSKCHKYIFYSEGSFYIEHYKEFIQRLSLKKEVVFLTSDPNDRFFCKKKNIKHIFIGNSFFKFLYLSTLNCNFFITTLTDIGTNILKSSRCKNYVYFFHSLASIHKIYKFNAFEHYDYIFCCGPYQKKEIRLCEKKFNFKKKKIIDIGYFYLDFLNKNINKNRKIRNTLLFAPSWNYKNENLFNNYGYEIIFTLIKKGYNVIFRPHPEILKRNNLSLKNIISEFKKNKNFEIDLEDTAKKSMERSEILITDNSTIAIEFLFVLKRSTLYINFADKIHNEKFHEIKIEPFETQIKKKFGSEISIEQIKNIDIQIQKVLKRKINNSLLEKFINNNVYNLKKSAQNACIFFENYG